MPKSGKGFVWFAVNGATDYCALSRHLADSIRQSGTHGEIAVITDTPEQFKDEDIDHVIKIDVNKSNEDINFLPEYSVFDLTPFIHTIKLEADMLITQDISWWWNHLCQHDQVFSHDCLSYTGKTVVDTVHRRLFVQNSLPNIYNGLSYFRYSSSASEFFRTCRLIANNWSDVRDTLLKNCTDEHPSTDVVYALACKILDPLQTQAVKYDFFRMIHYKNKINHTDDLTDMVSKHMPFRDSQKLIVGQHSITKPMHYHHRDFVERTQHG